MATGTGESADMTPGLDAGYSGIHQASVGDRFHVYFRRAKAESDRFTPDPQNTVVPVHNGGDVVSDILTISGHNGFRAPKICAKSATQFERGTAAPMKRVVRKSKPVGSLSDTESDAA